MPFTMKVKTALGGELLYNERLPHELPDDLFCSRRRIDPDEALLYPVRTDTWSNLAKDLFFPTLVNVALKCHTLAGKILSGIFAVINDIVTFPIRVITLIPRAIYNTYRRKEDHPLYQYLLSHGVSLQALKADQVYLMRKWVDQDGNRTWRGKTFNFVHLPKSISSFQEEMMSRGPRQRQPAPQR